MSDFAKYFNENMQSLGLPTPTSLFSTLASSIATASAITGAVEKFGTRVTIGELIGAGILTEKLAVAGALTASFYVGAVIGSIAVATGRVLADGLSIADCLYDDTQVEVALKTSTAFTSAQKYPYLVDPLTLNKRGQCRINF